MKQSFFTLVAGISFLLLNSCETAPSESDGGSVGNQPASVGPTPVKPYPLSNCLVTGEGLESKGGAITQVYQGQEVKVCCKPCQIAFKRDPETFLAKIP